MSSPGRRRARPEAAGPAQLGWAALVIAAALIGGLAAAALVHASFVIAVIVSLVAGGVALLAAFRWPARPPELEAGVPGRPEPDGQAHETVVQLLPLPPPGRPGASWWDSAQGAPPPSPGAKRAPAPDLSTYLAATFIAQCPRCGAFRLDIHRARDVWDFRCESCQYTWTWQPGTPWPPVRVKPRERPPAP